MRIMPSPHQLEYLRAIGALDAPARSVRPTPPRAPRAPSRRPGAPPTAPAPRPERVRAAAAAPAPHRSSPLARAWETVRRWGAALVAATVAVAVIIGACPAAAQNVATLKRSGNVLPSRVFTHLGALPLTPSSSAIKASDPREAAIEGTQSISAVAAPAADQTIATTIDDDATLREILRTLRAIRYLLLAMAFVAALSWTAIAAAWVVSRRDRWNSRPTVAQKPETRPQAPELAPPTETPPPTEAAGLTRVVRRASQTWTLAVGTTKGRVRDENQDHAMAFTVAGRDVLIVADGCGGRPHGRRAARLAVRAAARSIVETLASLPGRARTPADVIPRAFVSASDRLRSEAMALGLRAPADGLRTTLIIVVGDARRYRFGYIGDGGGTLIRRTGATDRFLVPMKDPETPHLLLASLGPTPHGGPVFGARSRRAGDLVIVGTDGVVDNVPADFCRDVLRGGIERRGDLRATVREILDAFANERDKAGYRFDDNLTLAIMAGGASPRLPPGFWNPVATCAPSRPESRQDGGRRLVATASPKATRGDKELVTVAATSRR